MKHIFLFISSSLLFLLPLHAMEAPKLLATIAQKGPLHATCYTHDAKQLITAGLTNAPVHINVWNTNDFTKAAAQLPCGTTISCVAAHPKKNCEIINSCINELHVWDLTKLERSATLSHTKNHIHSLQYDSEGSCVLTANQDGAFQVWDLRTASCALTATDGNAPILHATWSPDDLQITTCSDDTAVRIWDTRANKVVHALKPKTHVFRAAYNSTGTQLAISAAHQLMLYNPKSAALLAKYTTRGKKILLNQALQWQLESTPFAADGLQFVPENDDILIAGLDNGEITFCDLEREGNTFNFKSAADVRALAIAPDAKTIAAASWSDAKTTVWDLETLLKERAVKMRRSKDCIIE